MGEAVQTKTVKTVFKDYTINNTMANCEIGEVNLYKNQQISH